MIKQNKIVIKVASPTWAITKFLYGKCGSKRWNSNKNFIITIKLNG